MSDLAGRADRTWAPAEIDRVARSVRRQIWPEAGLLERVDVDRLAATPHTVVGPRGRILVLLVHHRGLPAHRWLEAHAVGDGVLLHANAASWREILDGHPRTRFGVAHELGHRSNATTPSSVRRTASRRACSRQLTRSGRRSGSVSTARRRASRSGGGLGRRRLGRGFRRSRSRRRDSF